jgi:spore coat protein U-like protein
MKKILISLIGLSCLNFAHAQTVQTKTVNVKTTATLAAVCTIASQNVNFGQIMLPVSSQSATSSMAVQCTKGSSYTINLAYGGVYGKGESANWIIGFASSLYAYNSSTKDYQKISSLPAGYTNTTGAVSCMNTWGSNGVTTAAGGNACYGYSTTGTQYTFGSYSYGKLLGVASGDSIGYFIQVPNQPSKVWNSGNYTYTASATGGNDSIPVVGTLVPAQTANQYPTADAYLDTVTATIQY